MKKIALSLVLATGLGLAACSQPAEEAPATEEAATTEAPATEEGAMTEAPATEEAATTEEAPATPAAEGAMTEEKK